MKLIAIMWDAYVPLMKQAAADYGVDLKIYANRTLEESPELCKNIPEEAASADLILLYRTTHGFWENLAENMQAIRNKKPVICVGYETSYWSLTSVDHEIAMNTYRYLTNNGSENFHHLMSFLCAKFGGSNDPILPPIEVPWQGIVHPDAEKRIFTSTAEYLDWYSAKANAPWVGVLMSRIAWISEGSEIESTLVSDLEAEGLNVLLVFTNSLQDESTGSLNIAGVIKQYFVPNGNVCVDAIIKLVTFMIGKESETNSAEAAKSGAELLTSLNVPVFQPLTAFYSTRDEWHEGNGLSTDVPWTITMPEFEGLIEPIIIGFTRVNRDEDYGRVVLPERSRKIARKVKNWIELRKKPVSERKVVFFLNNNPCSSVEGNIGGASHLDVAESVTSILKRMKDDGYNVSYPDSGKELMELFLSKKAISEFRWTTKEEIVRCGGTVYRMPSSVYQGYFDSLTLDVRDKMVQTWGNPPGEGMVLNGEILITGLPFGNAVVTVQPKRGCSGSQCDGSVCKILHDPICPPTHQYLATYYYYREIFGADVFVHVGTHGNLEFLPGKGTALSENCFPDVAAGNVPFLYIYNTDNPPEGTIAKRRGSAVLIGHMQSTMASASLYDKLEELDSLLVQYETARYDPARCHALHHMILDVISAAKLEHLGITPEIPMDDTVRRCHEFLAGIRNSRIDLGMHIFGKIPEGDKRIEMIASILRYDAGEEDQSLRRIIAKMFGLTYADLLQNSGDFNQRFEMSNGALIEWIDGLGKKVIQMTLAGYDVEDISDALGRPAVPELLLIRDKILDLYQRIKQSAEMDSLMNGLSGGYISPGPSGLATRGHDDVLPSGRNFYSLDPYRIPTTSAWRVGSRLADALIEKYQCEEDHVPENVAFYWMASDIMSADGEMMAEIFSLLGVIPEWQNNNQVRSFKIVPLGELTHPRIDVTIRTSGILRDNFTNAIDLVDKAVTAVASLDEPSDVNFVRKHVLLEMERGTDFTLATARVFSAQPGAYTSGVNLAVLAGAWKTEKDLAEIYIATNGYAYGNGRDGRKAHEQFAGNLETVSVTFNKIISDEHDLLGCCCYYGNQGGLTAAARHLSGQKVKAYYGDTREADIVSVRTLADELRRVVRTKVLNPKWIEGLKKHGYKGASDIMKNITRIYGWEATTQEVDDWIFDDIASTFVNNSEMRQFFEDNNPYALEEISRRLLEAETRGLWDPDPDVLEKLRESYLEIESWMEDKAGEGEFQGGTIDVVTADEVHGWGDSIAEVMQRVHGRNHQ